ncbi:uncharacterized protein [Spinacia oleracea]|uniref:Endonuclease/exonuclease/phosphatase domain-containing protein n=1 Tax=Spinacia oleracea TaxID=3562 RepID=A0A9R0IQ61_SPIOL|nr:uncharacterized protein LOC110792919 [Spinacia oleracea]
MGNLYLTVCPNWCFTTNLSCHYNGRIVLAWDPDEFQIDIIHMGSQLIHTCVTPRSSDKGFFCTFIYGFNTPTERESLWAPLTSFSNLNHQAWLVMGDFNSIMEMEDRIGALVRLADIKPMRNCMATCNLTQVKTIGRQFTWNNKQEGENRVFSRIDRVLSNTAWDDKFPTAEAMYLPEGTFDHCPMILSTLSTCQSKKPFRFYNMWTSSPDFLPIIEKHWEKYVYGCPMFRIIQKLKWIKQDLRVLNKSGYSNIEATKIQLQHQLADIQNKLHTDPTDALLATEEKAIDAAYRTAKENHLSFLHQTSKAHWLEQGDENSRAFYQSIR